MRTDHAVRMFFVVTFLVMTCLTGPEAFGYRYAITDLGTIPGDSSSCAYGINSLGQVVGVSYSDYFPQHAFLWSSGVMVDIGGLQDRWVNVARGINDRGEMTGYSEYGWGGGCLGFVYNGTMTALDVLPGDDNLRPVAINNSGDVLARGWHDLATYWRSVIYRDGTVIPIGTLVDNPWTFARDINDLGDVVGFCEEPELYQMWPFLWHDGVMTRLELLPGDTSGEACAINNRGQVVGYSCAENGPQRAFLYEDGSLIDLGALYGIDDSRAIDINDQGWVVGYGNGKRFLYRDGVLSYLEDLIDPASGWILRDVSAMNNRGQIVGTGTNSLGETHAFLLTEVPEPATLMLLSLGMAALCRRGARASGLHKQRGV